MNSQKSKFMVWVDQIANSRWIVWVIVSIIMIASFLSMFLPPKPRYLNKLVCPLGSNDCTRSSVEYTGDAVTAVEIRDVYYKTSNCVISSGHDVCKLNGSLYEIQ